MEFTLDDMKPASHLKIQTIQRTIRQLGEENIMTLLANPMFLGVNISEFSPEDKVMEALEHMNQSGVMFRRQVQKAPRNLILTRYIPV